MKEYEVTITRTGTITIYANSKKEALDMVLNMSTDEINDKANLTVGNLAMLRNQKEFTFEW